MSRKISGHVLPTHVDIFHSLCIPHAALHLSNSCERLNVPVLQREQNYGNESGIITWHFSAGILFNAKYYSPHWLVFLWKLETEA